ncbi:MAG: hypothetical protein M3O03_00340 [Pseudomonadota bacterium]|nr:hypothetical protein [Pseudomonadota bacterium]
MRFVQGGDVGTSGIEVRTKLKALGGEGPLKCRIVEARRRLSKLRPKYWHSAQAPGRIKRFLYLGQAPSASETDDVRAAFALMCAEKIKDKRRQDAELVNSIIEFANLAARAGEDYHRRHLASIRDALIQAGVEENAVSKLARSTR